MTSCATPWTIGRMHADLERLRRQVVPLPTPPGFVLLRTAIHVHSKYSHDSDGSIKEIAKAAKACGVQVVFLTDHANPKIFDHCPEGWIDGVFFVRGEEISKDGSLLGLGTTGTVRSRGKTMQTVIDDVLQRDGIAVIGHLEETDPRDVTGYCAVSIHNLHADANRIPWLSYPKVFLDALLYGKDRAMEVMLHDLVQRSGPELDTWDELLTKGRVSAIAEVDAHQNIDVLGLEIDPYKRILRILHTYLLVPEHWTRSDLLEAVRKGSSYVGFSLIADPSGFSFEGSSPGGRVVRPGDDITFHEGLELSIETPIPGYIVVMKDGRECARKHGRELVYACDSPGVYRTEVRMKVGGKTYPWIVSNPIYVDAIPQTAALSTVATTEEVVVRAPADDVSGPARQ